MMARSGAAGIQRYGVAMWSADIGSNLGNLASSPERADAHVVVWYRLLWLRHRRLLTEAHSAAAT